MRNENLINLNIRYQEKLLNKEKSLDSREMDAINSFSNLKEKSSEEQPSHMSAKHVILPVVDEEEKFNAMV